MYTAQDPLYIPSAYRNAQHLANRVARDNGIMRATDVVYKDVPAPIVESRVSNGYRKCTTGEYVTTAYRERFGWKNTYYQALECVVALPRHLEHFVGWDR